MQLSERKLITAGNPIRLRTGRGVTADRLLSPPGSRRTPEPPGGGCFPADT